MTVTTRDIERLTVKLKAEIDALIACAPAHADLIGRAALSLLAKDVLGDDAMPFILAASETRWTQQRRSQGSAVRS